MLPGSPGIRRKPTRGQSWRPASDDGPDDRPLWNCSASARWLAKRPKKRRTTSTAGFRPEGIHWISYHFRTEPEIVLADGRTADSWLS
jgi:hypothetical protein